MNRCSVIAGLFLVLVALAVPGEAEAQRGGDGEGDWIHKLSGPGVKGYAFGFETCLDELVSSRACPDEAGSRTAELQPGRALEEPNRAGFYGRATVGYSPWVSDDERLPGIDINRLKFGVSTVVRVRPWPDSEHVFVGIGTGLTWHRFSGDGDEFDEFWRHSFDLELSLRYQLVAEQWFRRWYFEVGPKVLYFPTRFTTQDFGGPQEDGPVGGEWAAGMFFRAGVKF